jgi:hypothetical protein
MTTYCPACLKQMPEERPSACPFCAEPLFSVEVDDMLLTPLPHRSDIEICQATPDRRIFRLRYSRGGSLIFFAVCWLAIVALFTGGLLFGAKKPEGDAVVAVLVTVLFWVIGFGLLFVGLRQRFLKVTILLERDRLVVERDLFGWKSADTASLLGVAAADLVVAYEENYKPVFAVRVNGVERKIQFGAGLQTPDKNWLVDEINGFLGGRLAADDAASDESPDLREASDEELESVLTKAGVMIVRTDAGGLQFTRRAFELPPGGRMIIAIVCTIFAGGWYAFIAYWLGSRIAGPFPVNLVFAVFSIPFLIGGLMPLGVAALALWGEARVEVGRTEVVSRLGSGRICVTRRLRTSEIDFVGAEGDEDNPRWRSRPQRTTALCKIRAGAKSLTLWVASTPQTCFALAELIRRRLPSSLSYRG